MARFNTSALKNFHQLYCPVESNAGFQLCPVNEDLSKCDAIVRHGRIRKPLALYASEGRAFKDVMGVGVSLLIVSDRLLTVSRAHGITGWRKFPVSIKRMKKIPQRQAYWGLSISGRAGPADKNKMRRKWATGVTGNRYPLKRSGIFFDVKTWDGDDLFLLEGEMTLMATGRVIKVLEAEKISGWESILATEVEF